MVHEMFTQQFPKMLKNLTQILEKAAAHADSKKFDMEVLLNSRLAPDQFNMLKQIQVACDTAKLSAARLTGKEAPVNDDKEKTLADVKARLQSTMSYLGTLTPQDFKGAEEKRITTPRWEGKTLSGAEYLAQWALPNFYFHISMAYAILRNNGVDIGKKDYLGELPFKA